MSSPPKLDIEGAKNRWDELQYVHITQSNIIHDVVSIYLSLESSKGLRF